MCPGFAALNLPAVSVVYYRKHLVGCTLLSSAIRLQALLHTMPRKICFSSKPPKYYLDLCTAIRTNKIFWHFALSGGKLSPELCAWHAHTIHLKYRQSYYSKAIIPSAGSSWHTIGSVSTDKSSDQFKNKTPTGQVDCLAKAAYCSYISSCFFTTGS